MDSPITLEMQICISMPGQPFQHAQPGDVAAQRGVPRGTPALSASEAGGDLARGDGAARPVTQDVTREGERGRSKLLTY